MTMTTVLNENDNLVDTIPEYCTYEDTGCEVASACLECPLPRCKFDDPIWYQRHRRLAKDFQIMYTIQQECLTVEEAAEKFSVTVRTVFRILQRCRDAMTAGEGQPANTALAA